MMMNVGALKSGDETDVFEDIEVVRNNLREHRDTQSHSRCGSSPSEKIRAARIAMDAGADFVKLRQDSVLPAPP